MKKKLSIICLILSVALLCIPLANAQAIISEVQKNFESFALSGNGGLYYLRGKLSIQGLSIPDSPSTGPQLLSSLFPVSKFDSSTEPHVTRYVLNGEIYIKSPYNLARISYKNGNILEEDFAVDGKTIVATTLDTNHKITSLSGAMSGSAINKLDNIIGGVLSDYYWQPGAAYLKVEKHIVGDELIVDDCTDRTGSKTSGTDIIPCQSTAHTLEEFFPYGEKVNVTYSKQKGTVFPVFQGRDKYLLNDGKLTTLAGVRAWISNEPANGNIHMIYSKDRKHMSLKAESAEYQVYYEKDGKIYFGLLKKDGTSVREQGERAENYLIYLNKAAAQSVEEVLKSVAASEEIPVPPPEPKR